MLTIERNAAQLTAVAAAPASNSCDGEKQNMTELGRLSWKLRVMKFLRLLSCASSLREGHSWDSSNWETEGSL